MSSISIELEIECSSCGSALGSNLIIGRVSYTNKIEIDLCEKCLTSAKDEARDEGRDEAKES